MFSIAPVQKRTLRKHSFLPWVLVNVSFCEMSHSTVRGWQLPFVPGASRLSGKESACQYRRHRRLRFDPWVRKTPGGEMATQSSILAWRIPWTEEPGGLQSMGSQRVRHDLATEHMCNLCSKNNWIIIVQIKDAWETLSSDGSFLLSQAHPWFLSFVGYAVTAGHFSHVSSTDVVGGAPQDEGIGKVRRKVCELARGQEGKFTVSF